MPRHWLLPYCLFASACATELVAPAAAPAVPGAGCEAEASACGASLTCLDGRCVAPQGTPCATDADCGLSGACFDEALVCRYDQARGCPDPRWLEPPGCVDREPDACGCLDGEVSLREQQIDGRLSCDGTIDALPRRMHVWQTGCTFGRGSSFTGGMYGSDGIKLHLLVPNEGDCSWVADRWREDPSAEERPALRVTCSASCRFWIVQLPPLVPEAAVPRGTFPMGTAEQAQPAGVTDEAPEHPVETSCLFLDRFEVSRAEYAACIEAGACEELDYVSAGEERAGYFARGALPVTFVTHRQATQYCAFRGKVLPSEAEWERAARGAARAMTEHPWGDELPDCTRANLAGCGDGPLPTTDGAGGPRRERGPEGVPIGSAGASHYGLYDLAGNVREWTRDFYVARAYDGRSLEVPTRDPETSVAGPEGSLRVVRGGSFRTPAPGATLRSSGREGVEEGSVAADLGLRCARPGTEAP